MVDAEGLVDRGGEVFGFVGRSDRIGRVFVGLAEGDAATDGPVVASNVLRIIKPKMPVPFRPVAGLLPCSGRHCRLQPSPSW